VTGPDEDAARPDDVGGVGEEAAKLLGALGGWARDHGLGDLADAASAPHVDREALHDHLATGAAECTYCPVCRGVHLLRQTTPEVRAHLAAAGSSLLQAAAGILAAVTADPAPPRSSGVEHVDLDLDDDDEPPRTDRPDGPDTDPASPLDRPGSPS